MGRVWRNSLVLHVKSLSKILPYCEQMVPRLFQLTGVIFIRIVMIIYAHRLFKVNHTVNEMEEEL